MRHPSAPAQQAAAPRLPIVPARASGSCLHAATCFPRWATRPTGPRAQLAAPARRAAAWPPPPARWAEPRPDRPGRSPRMPRAQHQRRRAPLCSHGRAAGRLQPCGRGRRCLSAAAGGAPPFQRNRAALPSGHLIVHCHSTALSFFLELIRPGPQIACHRASPRALSLHLSYVVLLWPPWSHTTHLPPITLAQVNSI